MPPARHPRRGTGTAPCRIGLAVEFGLPDVELWEPRRTKRFEPSGKMSDELAYFNGLNCSTGEYLIPPLPAARVADLARGEQIPPDQLLELKWRLQQNQAHFGVKEGIDPTDLAQAGWGVIFPPAADPALRDALRELLEHRKAQATQVKDRYREYTFQRGESKNMFLARNGAGPGAVDPDKVPYYLLIVG